MSVLEDHAYKVYADSKGENNSEVFVDPATIAAIIGIIIQIVKLYRDCKKSPEEATVAMADIGWWNRWKLRRLAKRTFADNEIKEDHEPVVQSLLNSGKVISADEVRKLYSEVV